MQSAAISTMDSGSPDNDSCNKRLQVAVVVGGEEIPLWIGESIQQLQQSELVDVAVVLVQGAQQSRNSSTVQPFRHLLFRFYRYIDTLLFPSRKLPAEKCIQVRDLENVGTVVTPELRNANYELKGEGSYSCLDDLELDLLLHLAPVPPDEHLGRFSRHGIWSLCHSERESCCTPFDGFWEVLGGQDVSESRLIALDSSLGNQPQVLALAFTRTCPYSANRNRDRILWKGVDLLVKSVAELKRDGLVHGESELPHCLPKWQADHVLSNFQMILCLPALLWLIFKRSIAAIFTIEFWSLAIASVDSHNPHWTPEDSQIREISPPKGSFWADPVMLNRDDKTYVYVEEYVYKTKRGHLAVLEIDQHGNYVRHTPILVRDYHLSYPFIFEWQGETFMTPESSFTNTVELYRCTSFPDKWEKSHTLLTGVSGVDPTLIHHNGKWWMFLAQGRTNFDELHLYYADDLFGPWTTHPQNPVKSDVHSSRPAGPIFVDEGFLYRPSQDCSRGYGYAICVNRITKLSTTEYEEEEVQKILPTWRNDLRGTHMLTHASHFSVVDQKFQRLRFLV